MPNSANRNAGSNNVSKGQPRHDPANDSSEKPNPERSDLKHGDHEKDHKGDTSRSSSQGRKESSGGSADD